MDIEETLGTANTDDMLKGLEKMKSLGFEEVTFEFIVSSFFQQVPINMLNNLQREYDRGFKEGYQSAAEILTKLP